MEFKCRKLTWREIGIVFLILVFVVAIIYYFMLYFKYKEKQSDSNNQESNQSIDNQPSQSEDNLGLEDNTTNDTPTSEDSSYQQAKKSLDNKDYENAIQSFNKAIAANPHNPDYYSGKSEAEYNLGQKTEALETVKQGLAENPDDDLLKSKLDVMQKDNFYNSSDQDTTRE